jgi:hypothetical protein
MKRLARANRGDQKGQDGDMSAETDSAQIQHNGKELRHDSDAN